MTLDQDPVVALLRAENVPVTRENWIDLSLQAGQQQLPTLDQFQAGLSVIDGQFAELGTMIATKVMAAIGEYLTAIEQRLGAIEAKLSSGAA